MKSIETTNIAGSAKAPFTKSTHDHYNDAIQETTSALVKGILGSYTPDDIIILYGCEVTATIPGTSSITAGAIYYNTKIYQVDSSASLITTGSDTLVWGIITTYLPGDSTLVWSDGVIRNLHRIDKLKLSAGASGSGLANYNGATVKYLSEFIPKTDGEIKLRTKVVEIGVWDMDTNANTTIAHGLTGSFRILGVSVIIQNDSSNGNYDLLNSSNTPPSRDGSLSTSTGLDSAFIPISRLTGGFFDTTSFNDGAINRGWVKIDYIEL